MGQGSGVSKALAGRGLPSSCHALPRSCLGLSRPAYFSRCQDPHGQASQSHRVQATRSLWLLCSLRCPSHSWGDGAPGRGLHAPHPLLLFSNTMAPVAEPGELHQGPRTSSLPVPSVERNKLVRTPGVLEVRGTPTSAPRLHTVNPTGQRPHHW